MAYTIEIERGQATLTDAFRAFAATATAALENRRTQSAVRKGISHMSRQDLRDIGMEHYYVRPARTEHRSFGTWNFLN